MNFCTENVTKLARKDQKRACSVAVDFSSLCDQYVTKKNLALLSVL